MAFPKRIKTDWAPRRLMRSPMTYLQFCNKNRITIRNEYADENPNMDDMPEGSSHWKSQLRFGRRRLTIPFSQGPAHCKEPTAVDLLQCLASDAASVENSEGFEDWASDLGYETDSRKAERTYKVCQWQAARLAQFLGDLYKPLLWECEE